MTFSKFMPLPKLNIKMNPRLSIRSMKTWLLHFGTLSIFFSRK
jgi:hypothetical protein